MQKIHMYLLPANSSEEFPVLEGETKKKAGLESQLSLLVLKGHSTLVTCYSYCYLLFLTI